MMNWVLLPLSGILSMDRNTAFNFMISRPFFVAALIGGLFGNVQWCILGGIVFEVSGLLDLPVGTRVNRDDTFAAFVYSCVISTLQSVTLEQALLVMLFSYILMYPATSTIFFTRWLNKRLYLKFPQNKEGLLILAGQAISFIRGVIIYNAGAYIVSAMYNAVNSKLVLPDIPPVVGIIVVCFVGGYFSGLFHNSVKLKAVLLLSGGVLSWLLL